jgi:DNA-binding transcriptional LysR family regulator
MIAFGNLHPGLKLQISFTDWQVDMVEEGFDLGICIAQLPDSTLDARKLLPVETILCASPGYLKNTGVPNSLEDLKSYDGLLYGQEPVKSWKLASPSNSPHTVTPQVKVNANNRDFPQGLYYKARELPYCQPF